MTTRESAAVQRAVARVLTGGQSNTSAARDEGIARSSLLRALRRRSVPPGIAPAGADHHAWLDGRTAARRTR